MLSRVLKVTGVQSQESRDNKLYRDLLRHEAQIGGKLFGPVPKNGRREFFCLDEYTWIWYEEWQDKKGERKSRTTRYNVRPDSIVKIQDGKSHKLISKDEAARFFDAVQAYERNVKRKLYKVA